MRSKLLLCLLVFSLVPAASAGSDPEAVALAEASIEAMGGQEAWDQTRYLSFKFFGGRQHYWDRHGGDFRIEMEREGDTYLFLMNAVSKEGRVFKNGEEVPDGEEKAKLLDQGHRMWVNDTYWVVMPFKLLDPGVTLTMAGDATLEDGRACNVLQLTFDEVGYTPQNKYHVFVDAESKLVEQWAFFADAGDPEPRFTLPWTGWKDFGGVKIATVHGQGRDWAIAVHDRLPASVFTTTEPVSLD